MHSGSKSINLHNALSTVDKEKTTQQLPAVECTQEWSWVFPNNTGLRALVVVCREECSYIHYSMSHKSLFVLNMEELKYAPGIMKNKHRLHSDEMDQSSGSVYSAKAEKNKRQLHSCLITAHLRKMFTLSPHLSQLHLGNSNVFDASLSKMKGWAQAED